LVNVKRAINFFTGPVLLFYNITTNYKSQTINKLKSKATIMKKFPINFLGLAITSLFLLFTGIVFSQTAPVVTPKGGFKIDGYLRANTPGTSRAGDWLPQVNGTPFTAGVDSFVLTSAGVPKDAVTTQLQRDEYNNTNDDIFTTGSKFNDYISALHHGLGGAPNKNDIHNGVFHASGDASGNQWVFIGGDRLDVSGTSYIDFQFLQGTLTLPTASTFAGSGPAGGRTISDINISMEYNNGGTAPKVVIYRWAPTNEAGTAWGWDSTGSSAITDAYAKTNLVTVDVPIGGFAGINGVNVNTYQPFAFVEAAINITQLITAIGGNCSGLNIKTLWITTKASSSSTAALKDYMAPISLDLNFGGVTIDSKGPFCAGASNITLTGTPSGGTFTGPGTSGTNGSTFSPTDAGVGTHTIIYTASAGVNCTKTTSTQIIVRALPTASISGATTVCKDAAAPFVVIQGSGGTKPYTFSYNIGGGSTLQKTTTGTFDTVKIAVPTGTAGSFVYNLVSVQESSSTTCSQNQTGSATVVVNPLPTAGAGTAPAAQCYDAAGNTFALSGTATNGTPTWSVQSKSNNAFTVGISNTGVLNPNVTVSGSSLGGTVTLLLTVSSNTTPACGSATSTVVVTVNGQSAGPDVGYTAPLCDQTTFSITVNGLLQNDIVTVKNKNGATIATLSPASPYNVPAATTSKTFTGIPAGAGYQVTVSRGGCLSAVTSCGTPDPPPGARIQSTVQTEVNIGEETTVKAYPNPFSDRIKFLVNSSVAGNGSLEIYNMMGQKVKNVYTGFIAAGAQTFELSLPTQQVANLVYVLRVGDKKVTGKILQMNK
jgi:hypothetical protein